MIDSIQKTVVLMRALPSSGDLEIYRKLVSDETQPSLAARLIEFVPMAYCRLMLGPSGVRFSDGFCRVLANGQVSAKRPLALELVWELILSFARRDIETGVSREDLLAVAGRSSEFDAINQLLNNGSKLQEVVLTSVILRWAESGPSDI